MAARFQVSCINKRGNHLNPHERIQNIGGYANNANWKISEEDAIKYIKDKTYEFYVSVYGKSVDVIIATYNGREYLKTTADGFNPDNLLSLPECA